MPQLMEGDEIRRTVGENEPEACARRGPAASAAGVRSVPGHGAHSTPFGRDPTPAA